MPIPKPDDPLNDWLAALAASSAAPGGGAAAAIAGALGAALTQMVAGLTQQRDRYAAVHDEARRIEDHAERLRRQLVILASRDAESFAAFTRALALPSGTEDERLQRRRARGGALHVATQVQLELLACLGDSAELAEVMTQRGIASAVGDAATAVLLSAGAARSAYWAVRSNLQAAAERNTAGNTLERARQQLDRIEAVERRALRLLEERVP